jgi:hypothetical protein
MTNDKSPPLVIHWDLSLVINQLSFVILRNSNEDPCGAAIDNPGTLRYFRSFVHQSWRKL